MVRGSVEKQNLLNPNTYKECKTNRYGINYKYIQTRSTPKTTYILQTLCEEFFVHKTFSGTCENFEDKSQFCTWNVFTTNFS
jgi:hypothetical protein